jgi:hypothetical protein
VESWTFGVQRQINKDTAIEVRYLGNRFLQGWTTYNLNANENNIVENGLLNEFKLAQENLQSNIAGGKGGTFAYTGVPGTSPLPITLAYFQGLPAGQASNPANYTSSNFTSSTFTTPLAVNNPNVCNTATLPTATTAGTGGCQTSSYANQLDTNATFRQNALTAGLPKNFMLTNPDLRGGANLTTNGGWTRYDAIQFELRRRMANGILLQANYQFAKGFNSQRVSFRAPRINALDTNTVRQSLKVNWEYQIPVGRGKTFLTNAGGAIERLLGGWEFHGAGRIQSGQLYDFGNVRLVGMTMKDLRAAYKLRDDADHKIMYILPQDIIDNSIKAFATSATSATGYGSSGPPSGRYLAPAGFPGCVPVYPGQCGPQNVYANGPRFVRFDLSVVKRVLINDRFNFELRAEMLNAFNTVDFFNPTGSAYISPTSQTFGQVTTAYSDSSNTNDPGGRIGQIVLRINW